MKTNLILTLIVLLGLSVLVSGQMRETPDYAMTADRQNDTGQCHELMVKSLSAQADTGQTLEEMQKHQMAAWAYEKLSEEMQSCE